MFLTSDVLYNRVFILGRIEISVRATKILRFNDFKQCCHIAPSALVGGYSLVLCTCRLGVTEELILKNRPVVTYQKRAQFNLQNNFKKIVILPVIWNATKYSPVARCRNYIYIYIYIYSQWREKQNSQSSPCPALKYPSSSWNELPTSSTLSTLSCTQVQ
jgi:hypothetical protein